MTAATAVSYAIYILVGVFAIFGGLLGLIRGIRRQTIRFATIIASIAISFIICNQLYPTIISEIEGYNLAELIIGSGIALDEAYINLLACVDATLAGYILALPLGLAILPIAFVAIFFVISAVMIIIHKILSGILGFTRRNNNGITRLFGMIAGLIQGAVVAAVFLIPVVSLMDTAGGAVAEVKEKYSDNETAIALSSVYDEYLCEAEANVAVVAVKNGGRFIYGSFATVEIDGEATDVTEVVDTALEIYVNYTDMAAADFAALSEKEKVAITNIINAATENKYTAVVLSATLNSLGKAFESGAMVLNYEEPILSLMNSLISVIATSDKTNLATDVNTAKDVYFLLSDAGVLTAAAENPDLLIDKFLERNEDGESLLSTLIGAVSENPRMQPLVNQMSTVAVSMLMENSAVDKQTAEVIESVKGSLVEALTIDRNAYATEEEYKAAVSNTIGDALAENGIELADDDLSVVSDFVLEEFEGKTEITDADLAEFMAKYYDVYKDEIESLPIE